MSHDDFAMLVLLGIVTTVISIIAANLWADDNDYPEDQKIALVTISVLLGPLIGSLIMAGGLVALIVFGSQTLGTGFAGLYRRVFPKKVELPKARIHNDA